MRFRCLFLTIVLFFTLASPVLAHRINIFALDEGGEIYTESTFAGKRPVKRGTVRVFNDQRVLLLTGETDEKGIYTFARPDSGVLIVEVDAGMGHKNSWELEAVDGVPYPGEPQGGEQGSLRQAVVSESGLSSGDWKRMDRVVEAAVTMALHRAKEETRLQDIVGGIGYIVGFFGLATWFHSRGRV